MTRQNIWVRAWSGGPIVRANSVADVLAGVRKCRDAREVERDIAAIPVRRVMGGEERTP